MILDEIIKGKRYEVKGIRERYKQPLELKGLPEIRSFVDAIKKPGINLITEAKAASPSSGVIVSDYDPVKIARIYERAGAASISVLTDSKYFSGDIEHLRKVKGAVSIPVLRKDFIIDEAQICESRLAGADALLLIVRILRPDELERLIKATNDLGMAALVEVHSESEAKIALDTGAEVIGINNRDLDTLEVDVATTERIIKAAPELKKKLLISESGISSRADIEMLFKAGVNAVLVGEAILKSPDMGAKIKELIG